MHYSGSLSVALSILFYCAISLLFYLGNVSNSSFMLVSSAALILFAAHGKAYSASQATSRVVIEAHVFTSDGKPATDGTFYLVAFAQSAGRFLAEKGQIGAGGAVRFNHFNREGETADILVVRCPGQGLYYQEVASLTPEVHLTAGLSVPLKITLPSGAPAANITVVPSPTSAVMRDCRWILNLRRV